MRLKKRLQKMLKQIDRTRWVGVMRWASGRGGRDALACINPPGYAEDRKKSAGHLAHRGPEGAVDCWPYGSCRPPPDVFQGLLDSMVYLQIVLGVAQRAAKISFPWPSVKGEVCMSRVGDCTKLPLARLRSTISSIKNTSNFSPKSHLL